VTGKVVKKTDNPDLTITVLEDPPQQIEQPDSTETFLNVSPTNLELTDIKIRFKLPKSSSSGKTVTLSRYSSEWIDLPTEEIDSDENFSYYQSETPGFSYFAIRFKEDESEIEENTGPTEDITGISTSNSQDAPNNAVNDKTANPESPSTVLEPFFQRFEGILSVSLFIFLFSAALLLSYIVIGYWKGQNLRR